MGSVDILTVSKRRGWEDGAVKSVAAQTVQPEQWVIVTELWLEMPEGVANVLQAPEKTRASNLNASLNEGLRNITADFVVFYQDFIDLQPDCIEKLLALADEKTFVTTCTPNYDGSDDGRYTGINKPRECKPEEWEANVSIAPMAMLRELGGFDERLDNGWSWDNVNIAQRAAMLGAKFVLDESNRPKLLPHELTSRESLGLNYERNETIIHRMIEGFEDPRLNYL